MFAVVSNWELKPEIRSETRMRSALGSVGSGELACAVPQRDESFALSPQPQNPPGQEGGRVWDTLGNGALGVETQTLIPGWPRWLLVRAMARRDGAGGCRDASRLSCWGDFGTPRGVSGRLWGFWHSGAAGGSPDPIGRCCEQVAKPSPAFGVRHPSLCLIPRAGSGVPLVQRTACSLRSASHKINK